VYQFIDPPRRGRPPKPPSPHAFDWTPYAPIAFRLTADYIKFWRSTERCATRPPQFWRDLHATLIDEAVLQMSALARRFDGYGQPGLYLKKFLPKRCAAPFAKALAEALGPEEEVPFSALSQWDDDGEEIPFEPAILQS
jgi:hypothetical protein